MLLAPAPAPDACSMYARLAAHVPCSLPTVYRPATSPHQSQMQRMTACTVLVTTPAAPMSVCLRMSHTKAVCMHTALVWDMPSVIAQ
eukprot:365077-Chlamydomonas_euryale.AAC.4